MNVIPTSSALGAEITAIDLRKLSDDQIDELKHLFGEYGVLFFRDQELTPEEHIEFAQRWGPININRFFSAVPDYPQIAQVLKEPDQTANIGGGWHTDHSYDVEPALGSILYALEVPATGGDTLFASMGAAYDALSDGFKAMLETLNAVHSSKHVFGSAAAYERTMGDRLGNPEAATQEVTHPVIIAHPDTSRRLLYVNPSFTTHIEGWSAAESRALLEYLYEHARSPVFQTRFHWTKGAVALWDNRATWHYALNDYQGQRRYMHRITIEGVPLARAR
jgi:taurine dioxygenase